MSVTPSTGLPPFLSVPDVQFPILPVGIHNATVDEVESAFVSRFPASERRRTIFDGWVNFRNLVRSLVSVDEEYIDGGFVTEKPSPKDVDVSFWISADNIDAMDQVRQKILHDLMATSLASYKVDAYIVPHCPPGHAAEALFHYMLWTEDNWSRCRDKRGILHPPSGPRKGYVRLIS